MKQFAYVIAVSAVMTSTAVAHTAGSGWQYPPECCNGKDCHDIEADAVEELVDGAYRIRASNEVFLAPTAQVPGVPALGRIDRRYRWSEDGQYHRCWRGTPAGYTDCLFIPQPAI